MSTPPLTEPELAGIEALCTPQVMPAHAWEASWEGAISPWRYCRHCMRPEVKAYEECVCEALPLDASSALRLVAEVRRLWQEVDGLLSELREVSER